MHAYVMRNSNHVATVLDEDLEESLMVFNPCFLNLVQCEEMLLNKSCYSIFFLIVTPEK